MKEGKELRLLKVTAVTTKNKPPGNPKQRKQNKHNALTEWHGGKPPYECRPAFFKSSRDSSNKSLANRLLTSAHWTQPLTMTDSGMYQSARPAKTKVKQRAAEKQHGNKHLLMSHRDVTRRKVILEEDQVLKVGLKISKTSRLHCKLLIFVPHYSEGKKKNAFVHNL